MIDKNLIFKYSMIIICIVYKVTSLEYGKIALKYKSKLI